MSDDAPEIKGRIEITAPKDQQPQHLVGDIRGEGRFVLRPVTDNPHQSYYRGARAELINDGTGLRVMICCRSVIFDFHQVDGRPVTASGKRWDKVRANNGLKLYHAPVHRAEATFVPDSSDD